MLVYIFYHTGSRTQSCHTFLICSDGMKSHRPGKKDHDGNCPYVEVRSCDLARKKKKKDFSQRMNCGDRWKQSPSTLQSLHLDRLLMQTAAVNHPPLPVLDSPNTSGVRGETCAPAQARKECAPA